MRLLKNRPIYIVSFFLLMNLFLLLQATAQRVDGTLVVKMAAQSVKLDGQYYLAIFYQNEPHWHTYWKNPGDAGNTFIHKFIILIILYY